MTSSRPYLIRALHEWVVDNGLTPHILVNAEMNDVNVPEQHIENGKIVLNLSPSSVVGLEMGNEYISFNARFGGKATDIFFPVASVIALYARENGQGMVFAEEDTGGGDDDTTPPDGTKPSGGGPGSSKDEAKVERPKLRVVK